MDSYVRVLAGTPAPEEIRRPLEGPAPAPVPGARSVAQARRRGFRYRRAGRGASIPAWLLSAAVIMTGTPGPASPDHGTEPLTAAAPGRPAEQALREAASAFLLNWVDEDGRVVRRDQGNDTVSEGQAYGLLISAAVGDEGSFEKIWMWTREHLMREDGLLSWHWSQGAVTDPTPASDADLDTARALVRAGTLFGRPDLTADGNLLAGRVMDKLTVETVHGRILLPGQWAKQGPALSYNPSYASPAAFDVLGASTGDARWRELSAGTSTVTASLEAAGPLLPDWARIRADGSVQPVTGPAGDGGPGLYSYDAARVPVRFSESCLPADVAVAADSVSALGTGRQATSLDLSGAQMAGDHHPVFYVARAAARASAGDRSGARADLGRAETLNSIHPTYYGTAWIALGRVLLDSRVLGGCPGLSP